MAKLTVRILDTGVSGEDRDQAERALHTAADRLPDGYLAVGDTVTYDGDRPNTADRSALDAAVDGWLKDRFSPDETRNTTFHVLVDAGPTRLASDALRTRSVGPALAAGVCTRVAGIAGDDGYAHGLAYTNTWVDTFVSLAPVPYSPKRAIPVTAIHELGHSLMAGIDAENEHYLGEQAYYDADETHAHVTPMTYWYDDQLSTWARNPNEVEPTCPVDPADLDRAVEAYSDRTVDAITTHIDAHYD